MRESVSSMDSMPRRLGPLRLELALYNIKLAQMDLTEFALCRPVESPLGIAPFRLAWVHPLKA